MRRTSKPFFILFIVLLLTLSLPLATSERLRALVANLFSPVWEVFSPMQIKGRQAPADEMIYKDLPKNETQPPKPTSQEALTARIIFRSPSSWNSSLWINVGSKDNQNPLHPLIVKNSPVLVGDSIVGVVDYVGKHQSRVRLITDSGLVSSVRVARGHEQNKAFAENVIDLIAYTNNHPELFENYHDKQALENSLRSLKQKLLEKKQTWYLAKGEIRGQSFPLWRTDAHLLKGVGFNYDFEDEFGPARDLRSGEAVGGKKEIKAMPLVKINDLLVTTGMDGVFPSGLKVAIVTKVNLLREGDFAFELEAKPTVGNLDDLTQVYVIAPLSYDAQDQPPSMR